MRLQNISIHPLLKGYIEKMWLFESEGQPSTGDIKLIVPNGRVKIAVPYKNALVATAENWSHFTREHSITLIGIFDIPSTLDIATNNSSGTICAEFSPHGAYRFFRLQLSELKNKIFSLTDIWENMSRKLEEQIMNVESVEEKANLFQQFLFQQFLLQTEDSIFEYCVQKIKVSEGKISVKELEKKTGYTSRWLNMKFKQRLGVSPKNFASIIRFKQYYEILCDSNPKKSAIKNFYSYYYDQSHFIKDFKRFTGLAPTILEKKINDFGKVFYNV